MRKALETALELEAIDRDLAASRAAQRTTEPSSKPGTPSRPSAPTPSKAAQPEVTTTRSSASPQTTRAPSKLALLAQAKAQKAQNAELEKAMSILKTTRAKPPPSNHLPPEHTEYLTPIANGSSVTTAITTSYQTLYSLTDPSRSLATEAPFVVPLSAPQYIKASGTPSSPISSPNAGTAGSKPPSKLAMKLKKAQEKSSTTTSSSVTEEEPEVVIVPPIFLPRNSSRSCASPSAFASVLIDNDLINSPPQANSTRRPDKGKGKATSVSGSGSRVPISPSPTQHTYHIKPRHIAPSLGTPTTPSSFAFDVPSPDDIIFNARRGTSLAAHITKDRDRKDTTTRKSTSSNKA